MSNSPSNLMALSRTTTFSSSPNFSSATANELTATNGPLLSVAICTHNPRPYLFERVLDALNVQTLSKDQWELLIIDNESEHPIQNTFDTEWHPNARVICESQLGLTPARLRAISESLGKSIVFVDDDNVLQPGYLETATHILEEFPFVGVFGGTTEGEFEAEVPKWANRAKGGLGVRKVGHNGKPLWALSPFPGKFTPIGAGLVVRRELAEYYVRNTKEDSLSFSLDRKGSSLMSGGDTELALCASELGLAQGVFPELVLTHVITANRLEFGYFESLTYSLKYSGTLLLLKRGLIRSSTSKFPKMFRIWLTWAISGCPLGKRGRLLRAGRRGEIDAAEYFRASLVTKE